MKTSAIRTLIVEDQQMFRDFLDRWLGGLAGFAVVGSTRSGEDALELVSSQQPDVVLLDLRLPGMDGLTFIRAARQIRPALRALVLTSSIDALALTRVREAGVEGYLEKDASLELLTAALNKVARGESYYSERFQESLSREGSRAEAIGKILSRREQEVLSHVLLGRTSREISEIIALSPRTVEFHRANVMSKLGATNLAELITNARQRGLE